MPRFILPFGLLCALGLVGAPGAFAQETESVPVDTVMATPVPFTVQPLPGRCATPMPHGITPRSTPAPMLRVGPRRDTAPMPNVCGGGTPSRSHTAELIPMKIIPGPLPKDHT